MTEVTGDTLPKMLVERATLSAGQTAIREKGHGIWQSWTWREVADNVRAMAERLAAEGLRVELDLSNEKIGYKVRQHSLAKVPVLIAIGKREAAEGTVSVRRLGSEGQEVLALDEAVARLALESTAPHVSGPVSKQS